MSISESCFAAGMVLCIVLIAVLAMGIARDLARLRRIERNRQWYLKRQILSALERHPKG